MDAETASAETIPTGRRTGALFVAAILVGSFLLFLVQPMIARMALPKLGGAPAVWNSAMLVYQALLLGGYAYAHWLGRFAPRQQGYIHLGVLVAACLWLPIGLRAMDLSATAEPALWVPWLLVSSIGPLFFAVSAQAPLLQRWFTVASGGRDPYALYAASNIGSFGGLLAYPLLVEPGMAIEGQRWLWSGGYVLMIALLATCAFALPRGARAAEPVPVTSPKPTMSRVALWIALAFVPSGLMLATSTFLTTDIVAVPLLWVLPLGLYLLSFSVAFASSRGLAETITSFTPVTILLFGGLMIAGHNDFPYLNLLMALLLLFTVAVALHTRMYDLRPEPDRLTGFYLAMSVGGALGGVFAGLVAPILFDWTWEYPLLIFAAGLLAPQMFLIPQIAKLWGEDDQWRRIRILAIALATVLVVWVGIVNPGRILGDNPDTTGFVAIAALGLVSIGIRPAFMIVLGGAIILFGGWQAALITLDGNVRTRSYFGVYTVRDLDDRRTLAHGTTLHGIQLTGSRERLTYPTTYYAPESGVGIAMRAASDLYGAQARIGVVGLGTGTLACYAKPGQRWRIFEIDPAVIRLSREQQRFTFLKECLPNADIALGDARLRLSEMRPNSMDLLALDAFSSDAIPVHLMTREAFDTYGRVLGNDGLLLVHISNRFLNLEPVVESAARTGGWKAAKLVYYPTAGEARMEATTSEWIALSRSQARLDALVSTDGEWTRLNPYPRFTPWTDDYASILPVVRAINPELDKD